jgi:hypothetical protein
MLAGYHFLAGLNLQHRVAMVCMLGAGNRIGEDALPLFRGKLVRVMADADEEKVKVRKRTDGSEYEVRSLPGLDAALRWKKQLCESGAIAETYDLRDLVRADGKPVKDLNDMALCSAETLVEEGLLEAFTNWNF